MRQEKIGGLAPREREPAERPAQSLQVGPDPGRSGAEIVVERRQHDEVSVLVGDADLASVISAVVTGKLVETTRTCLHEPRRIVDGNRPLKCMFRRAEAPNTTEVIAR